MVGFSKTKYKPKRLKIKEQPINFIPNYIHFYQWNNAKHIFESSGTLHWNGKSWEPFGNKDAHFFTMAFLTTEKRSFDGTVYSNKDLDFYKPFYYIPSTGTKVEISYEPKSPNTVAVHGSSPQVQKEIEEFL